MIASDPILQRNAVEFSDRGLSVNISDGSSRLDDAHDAHDAFFGTLRATEPASAGKSCPDDAHDAHDAFFGASRDTEPTFRLTVQLGLANG